MSAIFSFLRVLLEYFLLYLLNCRNFSGISFAQAAKKRIFYWLLPLYLYWRAIFYFTRVDIHYFFLTTFLFNLTRRTADMFFYHLKNVAKRLFAANCIVVFLYDVFFKMAAFGKVANNFFSVFCRNHIVIFWKNKNRSSLAFLGNLWQIYLKWVVFILFEMLLQNGNSYIDKHFRHLKQNPSL